MIELHSQPTPNGQKVMIMLEETGLPWKHIDVNIRLGEQFTPQHLKLSPNNKIPALVDPDGPGGQPYTLMESGAILIYLADKTGQFLPKDGRRHYDTLQWLILQMAHVGPMFGQANHFITQAKDNEYGRNRYTNEAKRLYGVINQRLSKSEFLGSSHYSIADIATWPWARSHEKQGVDLADYPNVLRWYEAIEKRPAVKRALALSSGH